MIVVVWSVATKSWKKNGKLKKQQEPNRTHSTHVMDDRYLRIAIKLRDVGNALCMVACATLHG